MAAVADQRCARARRGGTAAVSAFLGRDPARWRSRLTTWDEVSLGEVWPGITVDLRARGRNVEKVFTVQPGGAVRRIRVRLTGAEALVKSGDGALVARTRPPVVAAATRSSLVSPAR
jgi:hypothetical protein